MNLKLVKPDLPYFEQFNEMMREWNDSNTQIAPWFLNEPFCSLEEFADFVQMLDNCENANLDSKYCSTSSYFVLDENDKLIGATSLRHYLTVDGLNSWGHIGYGVRPSERLKGYATQMLNLMLQEARNRKIYKVLIGVHKSNIGSRKVVEKCNGILENIVTDSECPNEQICRYWINNY